MWYDERSSWRANLLLEQNFNSNSVFHRRRYEVLTVLRKYRNLNFSVAVGQIPRNSCDITESPRSATVRLYVEMRKILDILPWREELSIISQYCSFLNETSKLLPRLHSVATFSPPTALNTEGGGPWGWWTYKVQDFDTAGWIGILIPHVVGLRQLKLFRLRKDCGFSKMLTR